MSELGGTSLTKRDMKLGYGYVASKTGKTRTWYKFSKTSRKWHRVRSDAVSEGVKKSFPKPKPRSTKSKSYRVYTLPELLSRGTLLYKSFSGDVAYVRTGQSNRWYKKDGASLWRRIASQSVDADVRKRGLAAYRRMFGR